MNIIIGLGNPGEEYEYTKHNVGFRVVKYIQKTNKLPEFENDKKTNAILSIDKKKKVILALPSTFVNKSGEAVRNIIKYYKIKLPKNKFGQKKSLPVFLIHDDNDIPVGKVKISIGKSSAGHKGVESVIKALKTKDFIRFRIGIQPLKGKHKKAEQIVLKKFSVDEEKTIKKAIKKTAEAITEVMKGNIEKAYNSL